jgi:hypothetical protein
MCGEKITYPSRWIHTNELYFKDKKKFLTGKRKTLIGAYFVFFFMITIKFLAGGFN